MAYNLVFILWLVLIGKSYIIMIIIIFLQDESV